MITAASTEELHAALSKAVPGETIELAPGEYAGPFIITRPITLRGRNRQTVLWRRGGPVLYVRVAGVHLERLHLERTVHMVGPSIVHDPDCIPTGKESMELDNHTLINLGELVPGAPLTLPIEVTVQGRAEIITAGLHGLRAEPSILPTAGTHLITLNLDGGALNRGEMLLGELTLKEEGAVRHLWLTGIVLDATPPERLYCLVAKRMRLYPTTSGLIFTADHAAALDLGRLPAGRYAFFGRDAGGMPYVYMLNTPPLPVRLNGTPLTLGIRRVLTEHDSLTIGEITFSVQPGDPPAVEVPGGSLNLPDFSSEIPSGVPLTVRTLGGGWRGEVTSATRWLSVSPAGHFRLPPNRSHDWEITLNAEALTLPDGVHFISGGLLINGNNQVIGVDVRLNVRRPAISLNVAVLDLGEVEARWPHTADFNVTISNTGRQAWSGEVRSTVEWLRILTQNPISGGAWTETPISVQLAFGAAGGAMLPEGLHEIPNALIIKAGGVPEVPIMARLNVLPARGHLTIETPSIHFANVERNMPLPDAVIRVTNTGGAAWVGEVHAANGWVQVTGTGEHEEAGPVGLALLSVPPGGSAEVHITLIEIPEDQPLDQMWLIDQIQFTAGEGSSPVSTPVPIELTVIERPPILVSRPVVFPPLVRGETPPEAGLYVMNTGPSVWRGGVVTNLPFLIVPDREVEVPAGGAVTLPITLNGRQLEGVKTGFTKWEGALSVTGGRNPLHLPALIDLREPPNELLVETPLLNFGVLDGPLSDSEGETVRLLNAGAAEWQGTVTFNARWLGVEGRIRSFPLIVPSKSSLEFRVQLTEAAYDLPPGLTDAPEAITIAGSGGRWTIRALLMVGEGLPRLAFTPEKLTFSTGKPQKIKLMNASKRPATVLISPMAGLTATPSEIILEGGTNTVIEVRMGPDLPALTEQRGVVVVSDSRDYPIEIEITPAAAKALAKTARLDIHPPPPKPSEPPQAILLTPPEAQPKAPPAPPPANPPPSGEEGPKS